MKLGAILFDADTSKTTEHVLHLVTEGWNQHHQLGGVQEDSHMELCLGSTHLCYAGLFSVATAV